MSDQPDDAPAPVGQQGEDGSTGRSVRRGLRWSLIAQGLTQVGSVVATVILARILLPGEFGLVALAQSLLGVTAILSLAGVNAALVTRRGPVDRAASTLFWLALVVAVFTSTMLCLAAPPLTSALGQPKAAPYVAVLTMSFAFEMLALVPAALLQRRLMFGWLNAVQLAGATVYFVGEILLAIGGLGAWSVILAQVAGSGTTLALALTGARWRPRRVWDLPDIKSDLRLTAGVGVGQVLSYLQKNVDYWVVSRYLGAAPLGAYYVAYVVPNILRLRLSTAMRQVLVPAFAQAESRVDAAAMWRRSIPLTFGLALPSLVGLAVLADLVVPVFFGPRWSGAVTAMRVLTLGTVLDLVLTSVGALATARRLIRPYLVVLAVRALATAALVSFAVISYESITAVAVAVAAAAAVSLVAQEFLLAPLLHVSLSTVARPMTGYAALSAVMAGVLLAGRAMLPPGLPDVMVLAGGAVSGVLCYVGLGLLFAPSLLRPVLRETRRVAVGG